MRTELGQMLGRGRDALVEKATHFGIGALYTLALMIHPLAVLRVLQADGPQSIAFGYREFIKEQQSPE